MPIQINSVMDQIATLPKILRFTLAAFLGFLTFTLGGRFCRGGRGSSSLTRKRSDGSISKEIEGRGSREGSFREKSGGCDIEGFYHVWGARRNWQRRDIGCRLTYTLNIRQPRIETPCIP